MSNKNKPRVPRTPSGHPLGGNIHIIGDGDAGIPKKIQELIIAMFQEYVLPEFTKFNVVLEALAGRMEKLENDRRFQLSLDPELIEILAIHLMGTGYKDKLREAKEEKT